MRVKRHVLALWNDGHVAQHAMWALTAELSGRRFLPVRSDELLEPEDTKMTDYILNGHEVEACDDRRKWTEWFGAADRTVARTKVRDAEVSTVFLGIDHAFGGPKPLLFETMVFRAGHGYEQERYSTWYEAEAGHRAMCERLATAGSNA